MLKRAKYIFQTEGLLHMLKHGVPFLAGYIFSFRTYYLTEYIVENIQEINEADFAPKISNFTFKIISTNKEADELEAGGLPFHSYFIDAKESLDKGALALCIFIDKELASISWIAMTEQARDSLNEVPQKIDFLNNEVCAGAAWTNPRYRRMGFRNYIVVKRLQYLLNSGIHICRGSIQKRNTPALQGVLKVGYRIVAEGYRLKILRWDYWKEKPRKPHSTKHPVHI